MIAHEVVNPTAIWWWPERPITFIWNNISTYIC